MNVKLHRSAAKRLGNLNQSEIMFLLRISFIFLILFGPLWGCTSSSPKEQPPPTSPPTPPQPSRTPQEMRDAKKIVVEIYHKHRKNGKSGFILDVLNHRAYILTTALENDPAPLLVNMFYQGDSPAKVLYKDNTLNLALLSVEGIHAETFSSLSHEFPKTHESILTLGFPKEELPWTPQALVYLKTQDQKLLFSGKITEGYYGAPLIKEHKIIGITTGQTTDFIHAHSVETIKRFLKASIPEAKEILARNDKRLSLMVKANPPTQTRGPTSASLKNREILVQQANPPIIPLFLANQSQPSPLSVSASQTTLLSTLSRDFSPSLMHPNNGTSRETQTIRYPTPSSPVMKIPQRSVKSVNFDRRTIKRSPLKAFEVPLTQRPSQKIEKPVSVPSRSETSVLINAMCSALETNDTTTFLKITQFLQRDHPLFYLARNLETALTINDRKVVLQHSIKFLFEAFLLSGRSNPRSSCTQKLIKKKNLELESLNKTSLPLPRR